MNSHQTVKSLFNTLILVSDRDVNNRRPEFSRDILNMEDTAF